MPAKRSIKSRAIAFGSAAVTKAGLSSGRVRHSLISVYGTEIYSPLFIKVASRKQWLFTIGGPE
jgi:hypothetical protein